MTSTLGAAGASLVVLLAGAGPELSREDAVRQINQALGPLRDVTCTMIEEKEPGAPGEAPQRSRLRIKLPDKIRSDSTDEYGNDRLHITNGNVEWRSLVPKDVSKTVWPAQGGPPAASPIPVLDQDAYRLLRNAASSAKNNVLQRLEYRGIELVDGERCHLLAARDGRLLTWIAVADGLIRKQTQRGEAARHVTRFVDIQINREIDDSLFAYEPEEGARVDVSEFVDGEWRRHRYEIPYLPVPADEQQAARAKLAEIRDKFQAVARLWCRFSQVYTAHAAFAVEADGSRVRLGHRIDGTLVFEPPLRVRFEAERTLSSPCVTLRILLISDGRTVWRAEHEATDPPRAGRVVLRDRLLPPGSLSDPKRAEAALRGRLPDGYDLGADLPPFILAPLGGIDSARISFAGEEVLNGEPTYRFSVKATTGSAASTHWIGAADGVPRRIEQLNHLGNVVEMTYQLRDVAVDPHLPPGTFAFENDGSWTVVDPASWRDGGRLVDP